MLEGFGLLLTQKSFVVIVVVFVVVVFKVAESFFIVDSTLLLCGFAAAVDDAEDETHQQRTDHPDGLMDIQRRSVQYDTRFSSTSTALTVKGMLHINTSNHVIIQHILYVVL